MSAWLPYIVPLVGAILIYMGGRYSARQTATTAMNSTQIDANASDRQQLREERAQLLADLRAENVSLRAERDYWRGAALQALGVAENATDRATQRIDPPKEAPP